VDKALKIGVSRERSQAAMCFADGVQAAIHEYFVKEK
jgi:hypothetical protein